MFVKGTLFRSLMGRLKKPGPFLGDRDSLFLVGKTTCHQSIFHHLVFFGTMGSSEEEFVV